MSVLQSPQTQLLATAGGGLALELDAWARSAQRGARKSRVLVVEDESAIRESLGSLLEEEGYEVSFAENGRQALARLRAGIRLPDIIVLDLRMPIMDGWEFRAIQKDDPALRSIPVVAVSADRSAPAVTISAEAYLQKPLDVTTLLRTMERILFESLRRQMSARLEEAERLASLGRVAAGVGHEINNPLTFSILNLNQSLARLRALPGGPQQRATWQGDAAGSSQSAPVPEMDLIRASVATVTEMLEDCQVGLERIRQTVGNLQRLSRQGQGEQGPVDVRQVMEESISMAWNQIRHRAQLVKNFGPVPPIHGNAAALGQVFLNILVNAAQSISEGDAEQHEITVSTALQSDEVLIQIRDTGRGIPLDVLPHVFEPFFTTKAVGLGTGLGLSISRQTVTDHGGRIEVESEVEKGTVFRVFLPSGVPPQAPGPIVRVPAVAAGILKRGRVLVIDDEVGIGRVIVSGLSGEHHVAVVHRAADAFARFEAGERFDLVLCDMLMPVVSGPEVYRRIVERWPEILPHLVFMTGGAFTPETSEFIGRALTPVLYKPFLLSDVTALIRERAGQQDEAAPGGSSGPG